MPMSLQYSALAWHVSEHVYKHYHGTTVWHGSCVTMTILLQHRATAQLTC